MTSFLESCITTKFGMEYVGRMNVSRTGKPCLYWANVDRIEKRLQNTLADSIYLPGLSSVVELREMHNHCRSVMTRTGWRKWGYEVHDPYGPACFVNASDPQIEPCEVNYCGKYI